jgi:hypothetical protein
MSVAALLCRSESVRDEDEWISFETVATAKPRMRLVTVPVETTDDPRPEEGRLVAFERFSGEY